jgi:hypothetical protein
MGAGTTLALESARKALRNNRDLEREIRELRQQVEHLTLISCALAEVLRDQLGISGELIEGKVQEIDERDGKLDGRFHPAAKPCGACGRMSGPVNTNCIYCGAPLSRSSLLFS